MGKKGPNFFASGGRGNPRPLPSIRPEMISYTFRHHTPSDTKHLGLPGGAAGAMDACKPWMNFKCCGSLLTSLLQSVHQRHLPVRQGKISSSISICSGSQSRGDCGSRSKHLKSLQTRVMQVSCCGGWTSCTCPDMHILLSSALFEELNLILNEQLNRSSSPQQQTCAGQTSTEGGVWLHQITHRTCVNLPRVGGIGKSDALSVHCDGQEVLLYARLTVFEACVGPPSVSFVGECARLLQL